MICGAHDTKPTAVYRCFASDGRLLYVGCSHSPLTRAWSHANRKAWGIEIATISVEWHESLCAARGAETEAIKSESPEWNVKFSQTRKRAIGIFHKDYRRDDPSTWAVSQKAEAANES